jgi:hypothetical protein
MTSKTRLVLYSCSLTSALWVLATRLGLRQIFTLSYRNLDSYAHIALDITVSHPAPLLATHSSPLIAILLCSSPAVIVGKY